MGEAQAVFLSQNSKCLLLDILNLIGETNLQDAMLYVTKKTYKKLRESFSHYDKHDIFRYGDFANPKGYSALFTKSKYDEEDIYIIYYLLHNGSFVYHQINIPINFNILLFAIKGENISSSLDRIILD